MKKRIKIAAIGNNGNNNHSVVRYLRRSGYDADLIVLSSENINPHHRPESDITTLDYQKYTKYVNWGDQNSFQNTNTKEVQKVLKKYDFIIACGIGVAYLARANRKADLLVPYGQDISGFLKYRLGNPKHIISNWLSVFWQRIGLRQASSIICPYCAIYEKNLKKFAKSAQRIYQNIPLIYDQEYSSFALARLLNKSSWSSEFKKIRKEYSFIVFAPSRHDHNPKETGCKGNAKLFHAWRKFCKKHSKIKTLLILCEYGWPSDIQESKNIIQNLGIEKKVKWLPMMNRKDVMVGHFISDLVAVEFHHSWSGGSVLFEALVAKKAILAYRNDALHEKNEGKLYPIYNAFTTGQIFKKIEQAYLNKKERNKMAMMGHKWFKEHCVRRFLLNFKKIIKNEVHKKFQ